MTRRHRGGPIELQGWCLLPFLTLIWPTLFGHRFVCLFVYDRRLVGVGHSQKSGEIEVARIAPGVVSIAIPGAKLATEIGRRSLVGVGHSQKSGEIEVAI